MPARFRPRLTYANVVATMALFAAVGGGAYAATQLPKNSVGPRQLKKGAVTSKKIKDHTIVAADVNKAKLGKVPQAAQADNARTFGGLSPASYPPGPRAYAHVFGGNLVAADSKGVLAMSVGCLDNTGGCDTVGNPAPEILCFRLGFVPKIIVATPEQKPGPGGGPQTATYANAEIPAPAPGPNHDGCPSGYSAAVYAQGFSNSAPVYGLYITFY